MFNRNSLWSGMVIGIAMPLILYGLMYLGLFLYNYYTGGELILNEAMLQIIAPVANLFFIRYYFITKKYEDTGRGVLLVTFVYVIAYFAIN
jgi:hypothetical protein